MGTVYRAHDSRLGRDVAIKVLHEHGTNDSDSRRRFEREARAVAALNHPHICTLYDVGSHDGVDFVVMEHLEGETLAARLRRGKLPAHQVLEFALQIVSALDAAHRGGIVHRDLKPGNIMLTAAGAKLLDFGLAKQMGSEVEVTRSRDGTIVGTAAYMSPEQAQGQPVDARSDGFSFGALLYEMVIGRRAFGGETLAEVLTAVLRDEPLPPGSGSALSRITMRCLQKDPSRRFQSAAEIKAALEAASSATASEAEAPSVAVLPFVNMSPDPDNEFFSDGLAEEILNVLTAIEGLRVAARTSAFSFKGKSIEIGEIAKRLNVRHVLEGSVRKAGTRVRVTVQLVDASSGFRLWSERYDRQLADIFDVQDEIARSIVDRLKVALGSGAGPRLVKVATGNVEAYQEYLKGRAMLYRRGPWIAIAVASFQKAVALDPDYAQAWAGLADAHTVLCYSGYRRPLEDMPAAIEAANRAIVVDRSSEEAHNALACASLLWERDFVKAEREFLASLALNPRYIQARCWYGLFFLQWGVGRLSEGLTEITQAFRDDPLSSYAATVMSFGLATVGELDAAVQHARAAVRQDPESFLARWELGLALDWDGRPADAVTVLEPLWTETGHCWAALGLGPAYAHAGRRADAEALYRALCERRARDWVPPFLIAVTGAAIGQHEAAMDACEESVEERDVLFALFNSWYPAFQSVRDDPRFPRILERFNDRASPLA
jgi:serine/threonine-protein kinase